MYRDIALTHVSGQDSVILEDIAPLVGHSGTSVTEKVCRQQLRPVFLKGAAAMDRLDGGGLTAGCSTLRSGRGERG
jgi:hypothetical protein